MIPDRKTIESWLRTEDPAALASLWQGADKVRSAHVGEEVHLRGLVEISNHCVRRCGYCGLHAANQTLTRYRMSIDEIAECAAQARTLGFGTVVMQSGEDHGITREWMGEVIRRIKGGSDLAVTLSLGERSSEDLAAWKKAGADRYLLRFETSDRGLFRQIHPSLPNRESNRFEILAELAALGYEVGSGVMIGIPGQSYGSLAEDIDLFRRLDLDMIGVGPYILHPDTPMAREAVSSACRRRTRCHAPKR